MNKSRRRALLPVILLLATAPPGCRNPLRTYDDELGERVPEERTRRIDRLPIEEYAIPVDPQAEATPERIRTRFDGLERVEITLAEVRAWTLENNLDLRVALVNPTIANLAVTEEEARFEQVFFANFRRTETDQPTASSLIGSQIESTDFDMGVRVPLRTGGVATVRLPFNRTETNNPFTFLDPSFTADASFSIIQPLLRGAGRRTNTHAIRVASLFTGIEDARTKLEVIRQLAAADRSYWRLFAARRALDVAQQQYDLANTQLERARRRVRAGQDAEVEIIRAEEGVAQRLESIIVAENLVRDIQRELKRVVNAPGLEVRTPILLVPMTDPDPIPLALDGQALADIAVANRMEMLELELQLAIDQSTIDFERNMALPLFTVDYVYNVNGLGSSFTDALGQGRSGDFADWSLGLSAEIPIGNGFAESRVNRAILQRLQRLSTRDARRLSIELETLQAVDQIEAGWQRVLAARQSAILAGRTLQAEQRQFDVGARTSTDVLDAATRLADAQVSEIRAVADYQIALVDLAFATGTLLGASRVSWEPLDPRLSEPGSEMYQPTEIDQQWGMERLEE